MASPNTQPMKSESLDQLFAPILPNCFSKKYLKQSVLTLLSLPNPPEGLIEDLAARFKDSDDNAIIASLALTKNPCLKEDDLEQMAWVRVKKISNLLPTAESEPSYLYETPGMERGSRMSHIEKQKSAISECKDAAVALLAVIEHPNAPETLLQNYRYFRQEWHLPLLAEHTTARSIIDDLKKKPMLWEHLLQNPHLGLDERAELLLNKLLRRVNKKPVCTPLASEAALKELALSKDKLIRLKVAETPGTPEKAREEILRNLREQGFINDRQISDNQYASPRLLEELVNQELGKQNGDWFVLKDLAKNPNTPETLKARILEYLYDAEGIYSLDEIVANPSTPLPLLKKIIEGHNVSPLHLLENPHFHQALARHYMKDKLLDAIQHSHAPEQSNSGYTKEKNTSSMEVETPDPGSTSGRRLKFVEDSQSCPEPSISIPAAEKETSVPGTSVPTEEKKKIVAAIEKGDMAALNKDLLMQMLQNRDPDLPFVLKMKLFAHSDRDIRECAKKNF